MKRNKKIAIGIGVAILLYLLLNKRKTKKIATQPTKEKEEVDSTITPKIDTSDVPEECLDGFELDGKMYFIKDNKFQKSN